MPVNFGDLTARAQMCVQRNVLALAVCSFMAGPVLAVSSSLEPLQTSLYKAHYAIAIEQYARLPDVERSSPEASYIKGYALLQRHQFEQARPYLEAAHRGSYEGFGGNWPSPAVLLQSVNYLQRSRPPFVCDYLDGRAVAVRLYAKPTPWTKHVSAAIPRFIERAESIFGKDLPTISFYFFDNYADFGHFFESLFSQSIVHMWQDGTGNTNVVTFCETSKDGTRHAPGSDWSLACVLHEYGHALCTTYFGDDYLRIVPNWLNEGMADGIALPYMQPSIESAERQLKQRAEKQGPPSYEDLCTGLYRDPESGYAFARLMCLELLKGKDPSVIRTYLAQAKANGFEPALISTFGVRGSDVYRSVARRFWPNF